MIVKNEGNIFVPAYLDARFFRDALEEGLREANVRVLEIDFEWGSNPGDNYCSSIYRVRVAFERLPSGRLSLGPVEESVAAPDAGAPVESVSLIVKTIPVVEETRFLEDAGVFIKEKIVYFDVLPRLQILNNEVFGAKCFYALKEPINTIVFNDLKEEGFGLASRQDGLDWNHSSLILRQLAKFHAASMVLVKKDPAIAKRFLKGMLSPETVLMNDTFQKMFGSSLEHLVELTATWPGFEGISAKLQRYANDFRGITARLGLPQEGDRFTVLNHGDMWTNNFMFAYDDAAQPKVPTRAIFVDFQLCFFGSPGCDLNFFLNTSVQLDVLQSRREELVASYYESLASTLEFLRHDAIPSLEDLREELRRRELYGLFALYAFLPMVTMPTELSEDNSIEAMANEEAKRKKFEKVFASEKLQRHLRYGLRRLDDLGVLDEL